MLIRILKKCPHPSADKSLKKGDQLDVINSIGKEYVGKGYAEQIPRTADEAKELNKPLPEPEKPEEEENPEE